MGKLIAVLLMALVGYLLLWPVPIEPQAWTPSAAPARDQAPFARNDRLAAAEVLFRELGEGAEAIALGEGDDLYTGFVDGRIVKLNPTTGEVMELGNSGGRPLGLKWTPDGVVIADAVQGLLRRLPDGRIEVLSTVSDSRPFRLADDVDVAPDGRLYFSDASHRWELDHLMHDFFEHAGTGRLLRYDPVSEATETLVDNLYFANGVAVGPEGDYVLVTETSRYQVTRYWINGPKAGSSEIFIDNLPGFPDNITWDAASQTFWLALFAPRDPMLDRILPLPWLRKILFRLPEALQPGPARHAHVVGLDVNGQVTTSVEGGTSPAFAPITSAVRRGEWLYLGSLSDPGIGRIRLDAIR